MASRELSRSTETPSGDPKSPAHAPGAGAAEANVSSDAATCYTVRNGWAWAHIFVRHGVAADGARERHWVHVSVLSDFGEFGYCWTHIGGDWRGFLSRLNFDYAMQKMFGARFHAPLDNFAAVAKARALVLDGRRNGMTASDARDLWDALECDYDGHPADFLRDLDRNSAGAMYRNEMWDARWDEPCSEARGFWREIWPHFIAALGNDPASKIASSRSLPDSELGPGRTPIPSSTRLPRRAEKL